MATPVDKPPNRTFKTDAHTQSTVVDVASSSSPSQRATTRRPFRVARLLLPPSQARSSSSTTSRRRVHQPMTRDGGAHAVHGYTRRQAPKPDLEDGRAHAIYSRRRCLIFIYLTESDHPSPAPRRAPLAPSEDEPSCQARATAPFGLLRAFRLLPRGPPHTASRICCSSA